MTRKIVARVRKLLEKNSEASEAERIHGQQVAAAALLVECARVDGSFTDAERTAIAETVRQLFELEPEVAEMLLEVAEKRSDDTWHNWIFTEAVRRGFGPEARAELVRRLHELAHADGTLHPHEHRLITRIARELEVPESMLEEHAEPRS